MIFGSATPGNRQLATNPILYDVLILTNELYIFVSSAIRDLLLLTLLSMIHKKINGEFVQTQILSMLWDGG